MRRSREVVSGLLHYMTVTNVLDGKYQGTWLVYADISTSSVLTV